MNDNSQLTPPDPDGPSPAGGGQGGGPLTTPATPSFWARWRWPIIGAGGALLAVAAAAATLLLVLKPAPSIEHMVPATVDVYGFVNLDPSVSQKMNLLQAVHRFPDTSTDQKISDLLDKGLKDSGLSYSKDLQPWLGSGVGLAVKLPSGSKQNPTAVLAVSKDDAKAQAFLTNLRNGKFHASATEQSTLSKAGVKAYTAQNYTWRDKTYDGVTISVGTPKSSGAEPAAYAIVDHVIVVTNDEAFLHEIIDTAHGHAARLVDSAQYKSTLAKLPADHLAVGYLNGANLATRVKDQLRTPLASSLSNINDLNAFQGAALVVSVRSDGGIVTDVAVRIESRKLSPATREALGSAGHPVQVVSWIPASSDAFLAFGNLRQVIQSALDQVGTQPEVQRSTDALGLTGPSGVMSHLTGDFAMEVQVNRSFIPSGAVLIGTDNATALRAFFAGILALATQGSGTQARPTTTTYRGVAVTTVSIPSLGPSSLFAPSYAVLDGMGVVASNPAELRAIIDAHKDHAGIDHAGAYRVASQASLSNPSSIFYIDLGRLLGTLQSAPAGNPLGLNLKGNDNLKPLRTVIVTSSSSTDGFLERIILFID